MQRVLQAAGFRWILPFARGAARRQAARQMRRSYRGRDRGSPYAAGVCAWAGPVKILNVAPWRAGAALVSGVGQRTTVEMFGAVPFWFMGGFARGELRTGEKRTLIGGSHHYLLRGRHIRARSSQERRVERQEPPPIPALRSCLSALCFQKYIHAITIRQGAAQWQAENGRSAEIWQNSFSGVVARWPNAVSCCEA